MGVKVEDDLRFFVLNKKGEYAGVAMYASGEQACATCDEERPLEGLIKQLLVILYHQSIYTPYICPNFVRFWFLTYSLHLLTILQTW